MSSKETSRKDKKPFSKFSERRGGRRLPVDEIDMDFETKENETMMTAKKQLTRIRFMVIVKTMKKIHAKLLTEFLFVSPKEGEEEEENDRVHKELLLLLPPPPLPKVETDCKKRVKKDDDMVLKLLPYSSLLPKAM